MNNNIRKHIKNNFKGVKRDEIKEAIVPSIKEKEEITLPGLGVFFEIIWTSANNSEKDIILNLLEKNL